MSTRATVSNRRKSAAARSSGSKSPGRRRAPMACWRGSMRDGEVIETLHSRVGGQNHGITAAIETAQALVVVSKGSGRLLLHAPARDNERDEVCDRTARNRTARLPRRC